MLLKVSVNADSNKSEILIDYTLTYLLLLRIKSFALILIHVLLDRFFNSNIRFHIMIILATNSLLLALNAILSSDYHHGL